MILSRLAALGLVVGLALGVAAGPAAERARAASLQHCGEVTAYIEATLLDTGHLTVGAVPYVVASGASIPSTVAVGAELCFQLTTDSLGLVTAAEVTPDATTRVRVCGEVTRYAAARSTATGALDVAGRAFAIAAGTRLPSTVVAGAELCLDLELNGLGQVDGGSATVVVAVTASPQTTARPTPTPTLHATAAPIATPPSAVITPRPQATQPAVSLPPGRAAGVSPAPVGGPRSFAPERLPSRSPSAAPTPTASPTAASDPPHAAVATVPSATIAEPAAPAGEREPATLDAAPAGRADIVPGPASLARTGVTVAVTAIPLAFVGLFGLAAGWYANRRRDADAGESLAAAGTAAGLDSGR